MNIEQKAIFKDVENLSNNLLRLKETTYKEGDIRQILSKNIKDIFDKWSILKIGKWKQNLLFDKAESFIENDNYSLRDLKIDIKAVLEE